MRTSNHFVFNLNSHSTHKWIMIPKSSIVNLFAQIYMHLMEIHFQYKKMTMKRINTLLMSKLFLHSFVIAFTIIRINLPGECSRAVLVQER
jgi:hypothetical protein